MILVKPVELRSSCRSVKVVAILGMLLAFCCFLLAVNYLPKPCYGMISRYYLHNQINSFLIKQLGSTNNDPRENLKVASEYLAKLEKSRNIMFTPGFMDALRSFTRLEKIVNHESNLETEVCTGEMYKVLKKLNRITKASSNSKKRVDAIVYQATLMHAHRCLPAYLYIFKNKYQLLSRLPAERVEIIFNPIIQADSELEAARSVDKSPIEIIIFKLSNSSVNKKDYLYNKKHGPKTKNIIDWMAERDGKIVLPRSDWPPAITEFERLLGDIDSKIARELGIGLFKEYLLDPCEYYVNQLGEELFLPAEFDLRSLFRAEKRFYQPDTISQDTIVFYYAWARFKLCQKMIKKQSIKYLKYIGALGVLGVIGVIEAVIAVIACFALAQWGPD